MGRPPRETGGSPPPRESSSVGRDAPDAKHGTGSESESRWRAFVVRAHRVRPSNARSVHTARASAGARANPVAIGPALSVQTVLRLSTSSTGSPGVPASTMREVDA